MQYFQGNNFGLKETILKGGIVLSAIRAINRGLLHFCPLMLLLLLFYILLIICGMFGNVSIGKYRQCEKKAIGSLKPNDFS